MLQLPAGPDGRFPDADIPDVWWRLPERLAPADAAPGVPDVQVTRFEGGGSLRLRLQGVYGGDRAVPFVGGRVRFVLTTPSAVKSGDWRPIAPRSVDLVDLSLSLVGVEADIAARVGEAGGSLVEVEVELAYEGRPAPIPWLARLDGARLVAWLVGSLGEGPWAPEAVTAALRSLDASLVTWFPLEPHAPPRVPGATADELAARLAADLFDVSPSGWTLRTSEGRIDLPLDLPRVAREVLVLRWSFSAFYAALSDPSVHFATVALPVAFQTATLHVVQSLPIADDAVVSLTLEVDAGEVSGRLTHRFVAGESVVRLPFIHRTTSAPPRWRALALVSGRQGLVPVETPWRGLDRLLVEISPETTGIYPVRISARPEVFAHAVEVTVRAGSREVSLTAATAQRWLVFRDPPKDATAVARGPDGTTVEIGGLRAVGREILVDEGALGVGEVVEVRVRRAGTAAPAWLGVRLPDGVWRTLDAGEEVRWRQRRASRLAPPATPYQLRWLPARGDGGAGALVLGEERVGVGVAFEVAP